MTPSTGPGSCPWSFSACCTFFTSSLPFAAPVEWEDDMPEDVSEEEDIPDELPDDDMPVSPDWLVDVPDLLAELRLVPAAPLVPL
ncbi:MAG TPA: hypothetical protein VH985_23720 [Candidatus Binatia bacterium]